MPKSRLQQLVKKTEALFSGHFGRAPEVVAAAPGRANLIGEHTDYNDGHVLPIAIDRYIAAAIGGLPGRRFHLRTANLEESFEFDLDQIPEERPHWAAYMLGIIAELENGGQRIGGKQILVFGDLPIGSGLSSSAALEVSVATALERLEGLQLSDAQLVNACRRADRNYVGIHSGPMDQFASRACREGHAGLLDCRTLELTHHRLPEGMEFLSIYSGIPRKLAGSVYNERQGACMRAVELLQQIDPETAALRDATMEQVEAMKDVLGETAYRRARHVVTEQGRVFGMVRALRENDRESVRNLLLDGHYSLSRDYEVSFPILDEMIEWFCAQPGVVGARLTGAGFGGSIVGVCDAGVTDADGLSARFAEAFGSRTPEAPAIWKLAAVDGAKYQCG